MPIVVPHVQNALYFRQNSAKSARTLGNFIVWTLKIIWQ